MADQGGDFNIVKSIEERKRCSQSGTDISYFNDFIDSSELTDLPLVGKKFTRYGVEAKRNRIDRGHDHSSFLTVGYQQGTFMKRLLKIGIQQFLMGLPFKKLSREDATSLESPVSMEEVKATVWECNDSKALELDGFNPNFLNAFGILPISLVNSLHKILARLLANQLKKVIFTVIRDTQSTFNNGHQIMDSILFANKINHNMKKMHITKEVSLSNLTLRRHLIVLIGILFYVSWRPWVSALNGEALKGVIRKLEQLRRAFLLGRGVWIPSSASPNKMSASLKIDGYMMRNPFVKNIFTYSHWPMIKKLRSLMFGTMEDKLVWVHDPAGNFSVKKFYSIMHSDLDDRKVWFHSIWNLSIPSKVQCFLWLAIYDSIPTKSFLASRGVFSIGRLSFYGREAQMFDGGIWLNPLVIMACA
ncbi:Uncharacterized protein TCM_012030 [Theobroma cacao]|uniref:Reverse transcriptase zinc-binding domain-containing protein n=1 Tax=Theobroma cacao TaxID=3641 RepID=A0A061FV13_THECC|nr:Uncharacterized protein TCM_012030 [Theobroma cacao]